MEKAARIDASIPVYVKEMIDSAAALEGRTRTDFLMEAAAEKAGKVISESQSIQLSLRDQKCLPMTPYTNQTNSSKNSLRNTGKLSSANDHPKACV